MSKLRPAMIFHPGELIAEELRARDQTAEVMRRNGWTDEQIAELLRGERAMDDGMALRLARIWGTSVELWLNLQASWNDWPDRRTPPPRDDLAELLEPLELAP